MAYALAIIIIILGPGALLTMISFIYDLELSGFVPLVTSLSILFAGEFIALRNNGSFIWNLISRSARDKLVFSFCLVILITFISLPLYLKTFSWWIILSTCFCGYVISYLFFRFFASQTMKDNFAKTPNILGKNLSSWACSARVSSAGLWMKGVKNDVELSGVWWWTRGDLRSYQASGSGVPRRAEMTSSQHLYGYPTTLAAAYANRWAA